MSIISTSSSPCLFVFKHWTIFHLFLYISHYFCHISGVNLTSINEMELNVKRLYFDDMKTTNVSVAVGDTAILNCRVKNKGNRTVSWIRKRDLHVLTTNTYTYTGDQRFSIIHTPGSDDWNLKIQYTQTRDMGIYECQVNTEPKINIAVILEVTAFPNVNNAEIESSHFKSKASKAKILGSTEIHVKRDSTIALACTVNIHASSVSWYHGTSLVDFDSLRGGISLETEKTDSGTTSRLMLTRASIQDSGNYTCVPTGASPASVRVHVLTGEQPAAMQTSKSHKTKCDLRLALPCLFMLMLWDSVARSHLTISILSFFINLQFQSIDDQYAYAASIYTNTQAYIHHYLIQQTKLNPSNSLHPYSPTFNS